MRTKKIVELVARTITEKRPDLEAESIKLAEMGLKASVSSSLSRVGIRVTRS